MQEYECKAMMDERPLAPALGRYRLPLAAWLSIAHRLTGLFLLLLLGIVVSWLWAVAAGASAYAAYREFWETLLGQLLLWSVVAAGSYHSFNGLRHIAWDLGWLALTPRSVQYSGIAVLLLTVLLWSGVYGIYHAWGE